MLVRCSLGKRMEVSKSTEGPIDQAVSVDSSGQSRFGVSSNSQCDFAEAMLFL